MDFHLAPRPDAPARFRQPVIMQPPALKILIIEDVPGDAMAIEEELRAERISFQSVRVETREDFLHQLHENPPDVVLSDFTLPEFDAIQALHLLQEVRSDLPFILVTGTRSEEVAVECIKEGADDYILKASLKRLPSSILNVLKKKEAEREKARAEEALRALPSLILEAQEAERRRVARELHDSVNQILSSVKFRVQAVEEKLGADHPNISGEARRAREILDKAIQEVRRISRNLRPSELDDLGLGPALRSLTNEIAERTGISVRYSGSKLPCRLPKDVELNLYRIIQEALSNIEHHARATAVSLNLARDPSALRVTLNDNGCGFDTRNPPRQPGGKRGMGLVDMNERAHLLGGAFALHSTPGHGTTIQLHIPLGTPEPKPRAIERKKSQKNQVAPGR